MATANHVEQARADGVLFGIPLGDLGWFASLLMGTATGFAAFFLTTFVAIVTMLFDQAITHRIPNYDNAYKHFGLPVGLVVLALALGYLGFNWSRRMARKAKGSRG
jgi:ABC-type dipeptide/oligopeptide/nickel transport system permease subunit